MPVSLAGSIYVSNRAITRLGIMELRISLWGMGNANYDAAKINTFDRLNSNGMGKTFNLSMLPFVLHSGWVTGSLSSDH